METYTEEVSFLVAQTGPLNGQRWAIRGNMLIGREATCDIVVSDRQVSRHHARISLTSDGISVEDLDSKNGTHLNSEPVAGKALLQDGDVLQIALAQKFVFLSSDATLPLEDRDLSLAARQSTETLGQRPMPRRLTLDKRSRSVWICVMEDEEEYQQTEVLPPLSVSQFRLLELLYDNPGRVAPRHECISTVWGEDQAFDVSEQALDALVRRLRNRIARVDPTHEYIVTVRGHGLRLDNPALEDLFDND